MIVVLNGRTCCLLGLTCCIPPGGAAQAPTQVETLAWLLREATAGMADGPISKECADQAAAALLEHVDLVPKGAGEGIKSAYARFMIRHLGHATPTAAP